ncbi:uncharacterized protein LOC143256120 isoform X3 [Tachypleus tridentatus]|uniref:uncharacterized protein LOC143256120 isoform X3 n=1 Tax=Tachypleus tridentatus TaxID=6853 RepID=UPI003FD551D8
MLERSSSLIDQYIVRDDLSSRYYPSQPGTEEETYVPSPRKTPSMSEHTIPLVTAAVGIPLLLIFLRDAAGVNLPCPPWGTEPAYFSVICSYTY